MFKLNIVQLTRSGQHTVSERIRFDLQCSAKAFLQLGLPFCNLLNAGIQFVEVYIGRVYSGKLARPLHC